MNQNRTDYVKKNILYNYISTIITSICSIICRTIFIYTLGPAYLGLSGLFTNVLGVLSFSELGIRSAIVFALYKPIAENDREKIKSLLLLYKKAYRLIALIVTCIGIIIVPFFKYLVNTDISMVKIKVFYFVFLFNTVSSYFVTYKTSYISAIQREYIVTNIATIGTCITNILQILFLLCGGQYLGYLIIASVMGLLQNVATVIYLNKNFSILMEKNIQPLDNETRQSISKNVKALIIHKIGDISVNQTDNILVSAFVSTTAVGLLANYTVLNSFVASFTNKFFRSFTAGFGNMLVKEDVEMQRKIFDDYDLLGFWIYGFVLIAFITLSQPFIVLWLGDSLLLDNVTVILYFVSMYLSGMTFIPYNFKVAAGCFNEDKWVAFIQAIINLVVSVIAIKMIGLPGIFVGTIVSRMVVVLVRPYIVYKYILKKSVKEYYTKLIIRTGVAFLLCIVMWRIKLIILCDITSVRFVLMCILTVLIPNIAFMVLFGKSGEFKDIVGRIKK